MALADTANLVVQLRLDDKLSAPLRGVNTSLTKLGVNSGLVGKGLSNVGKGLALTVARGAGIAAIGLGAVSTQVVAGVKSLQQLEDVQLQTAAAIKSTGGAAGVTAKQVRDLAEEYETLGGVIDDKVIQAGENVLLTFTRINEKAFQPALEAALDLSTRMDQDLNTSIVQIGKALNDPIKGLTSLGRIGVQFTDKQKDLIKRLVEENDLLGAQKVILGELGAEFGGSFAARGKTGAAAVARMQDAIEGLQQNLATAFIPVIDKVARKLNTLFSDPEVIKGVRDFGKRLASFATEENLNAAGDAVRNVFGYLAEVPWGTIGQGLKIAGAAAKVAVDAFNSLPKEVQGIVISALAVQKLSGGLVGTGLGQIGKGLFGGLFGNRGATALNPVFTKEVGLPGGGGPGGLLSKLPLIGGGAALAVGLTAASIAALGVAFVASQQVRRDPFAQPGDVISPGRGFGPMDQHGRPGQAVPVKVINLPSTPLGQFNPANAGGTPTFALPKGVLKTVDAQLRSVQTMQTRAIRAGNDKQARILQTTLDQLHGLRGDGKTQTSRFVAGIGKVNAALSVSNRNLREGTQKQRQIARGIEQARDRIGTGFRESNDKLGVISRKQTSFTAHVTTNVNAQLSVYSALSQVTRVNTIRSGFQPTGPNDF